MNKAYFKLHFFCRNRKCGHRSLANWTRKTGQLKEDKECPKCKDKMISYLQPRTSPKFIGG